MRDHGVATGPGDQVVLRPWRDADLDWWIGLLLAWRPEWSADELRQRSGSGRYVRRTIAATPDGTPVGSLTVLRPFGSATHVGFTLLVDPAHRRRGVGAALWDDISPWIEGVEILTSMPGHDAESRAIATRWGFEVVSVSIESELDVSRGVPAPRVIDGVDVVVRSREELVADGPDISDLLRASQTNPEAADLGWQFTPDDLMAMVPDPVWVVLVERGTPVALSLADASEGDRWDVYFTGVAPEHRGRGLGRLVKENLHAAAAARGARTLGTGNEERNVAVRALNDAMGYVVVGSDVRMRRPGSAYDGRSLG